MLGAIGLTAFILSNPVIAAPEVKPWLDSSLSAQKRTVLLLTRMTDDEKLKLVYAIQGTDTNGVPAPPKALQGASYIPELSRLSIPAFISTNAGVGVARRYKTGATALPSQMALAASWDTGLARRAGAMIGEEARNLGFNVMLAGGVNLPRDPRAGRNFEYSSEDPLLAGRMVGALIKGVQSQYLISTIKHFALNNIETNRMVMSGNIDLAAFRESDLLAFEIAIENGRPGAVMTGYNRVNDVYAGENSYLLSDVLKGDWKYPYFVMSDWGGTHSTVRAVMAGLDQESSGNTFDSQQFFLGPLKDALKNGQIPHKRLDDMASRILLSMFSFGLFDHRQSIKPINFDKDRKISLAAAEEGIVLLKNTDHILPLSGGERIAVIGGNADIGVLGGGGSANVIPNGGNVGPDPGPKIFYGPKTYLPDPPLRWLQKLSSSASNIEFNSGKDVRSAASLASRSDIAIVFVTEWSHEAMDRPSMTLPDDQDALINAVATANPRTIVVLENNVLPRMPWLSKVAAVIEAWYPGSAGGEAIAKILSGQVNPSGHLPVVMPLDETQLPRKTIQAAGRMDVMAITMLQDQNIFYTEGADVGYRWLERNNLTPQFPFGFGLSYSRFKIDSLQWRNDKFSAVITNMSEISGSTVVQFYMTPPGATRRLVGWSKVTLPAHQSEKVQGIVDFRTIAKFSTQSDEWVVAPGQYDIAVGENARDISMTMKASLNEQILPP